MAAVKKGAAKGKRPPKKGLRGRMPTKRSINLILIDENKISPLKAVPGIILVVVLAAAFSKYFVADRLIAMSRASNQASSVQSTLDKATQTLKEYEGIEDTYAHLTYAGMTQEELDRVDRVKILELVSTILPQGESTRSWNVSGNILTVEITGSSLENLNQLARRIEESPIVDSCAIATAVKNEQKQPSNNLADNGSQTLAGALESRRQAVENGLVDTMLSAMNSILKPAESQEVQARFTIYLRQPPEEEETSDAPADEAPEDGAAQAAQTAGPGRRPPSRPVRSTRAQGGAAQSGEVSTQ